MPKPTHDLRELAPDAATAERSRAAGAQLADELAPHIHHLRDALERARRRGAPERKVRTESLAAVFTVLRLSTQATVAVDRVRQLSWWKRLLVALREPRPERAP